MTGLGPARSATNGSTRLPPIRAALPSTPAKATTSALPNPWWATATKARKPATANVGLLMAANRM